MPARFRVWESESGYMIVDSRPHVYDGAEWFDGLEFNNQPYHPQFGVGMSFELSARDYYAARMRYFRPWGRRVKDCRVTMSADARKLVRGFILECGGTEKQVADLQAHADAEPIRGPYRVRYESKSDGYAQYDGPDGERCEADKARQYATLADARRAAKDCNDSWRGIVESTAPEGEE